MRFFFKLIMVDQRLHAAGDEFGPLDSSELNAFAVNNRFICNHIRSESVQSHIVRHVHRCLSSSDPLPVDGIKSMCTIRGRGDVLHECCLSVDFFHRVFLKLRQRNARVLGQDSAQAEGLRRRQRLRILGAENTTQRSSMSTARAES